MGLIIPVFVLILISTVSFPPALSQTVSIQIEGSCMDYKATIKAAGFERGCYDAKVDVSGAGGRTGQISDKGDWKSSFFYIENGLCVGDENQSAATYALKAGTSAREVVFEGSLRNGTKTWVSEPFTVRQSCPQQDELLFLPVVLLVILLLLIGLAVHLNWKAGKQGKNIKQKAK